MYREYDQNQIFLLPPSLKDFVDESHPSHMVNDLVEKMDLFCLEKRYGNMGQPAHHPRMMIKTILYGFTVGVFSSRKLQRACRENLAFKYLAGMQTPAFKTFIEFRRRHRDDMEDVFLQTVKLAREMGMAQFGGVALDGCKKEANTSKHKAMSYGRMLEEEKRLKSEIEKLLKTAEETDAQEDREHGADDDGYSLPEEFARREKRLKKIEEARAALEAREKKDHPEKPIDPKKQISFADKEARCFSKKADGTKYVYNSQAAVDMESQIIIENHIEDSVSDAKAAEETLENLERNLGEKPNKLVTDAGYGNSNTVESCQKRDVTPVSATTREGKESASDDKKAPGSADFFTYNSNDNTLVCRHGCAFEFDHFTGEGKRAIYCSRDKVGCTCGSHSLKDGRRIMKVDKGYLARQTLKQIMNAEGNRELYRRRKCTVEPVFGQITEGMGFRRYFYRGSKKVRSEWNLVCAAFNIKKIAALKARGKAAVCERKGVQGKEFPYVSGGERFLHEIARYMRLFRSQVGPMYRHIVLLPHCA